MFRFLQRKRIAADREKAIAGYKAVLVAYEKLGAGKNSSNLWIRSLHSGQLPKDKIDAYRLSLHEMILHLHRGPDNVERIINWATSTVPSVLSQGESAYAGSCEIDGEEFSKADLYRAHADFEAEIACEALKYFDVTDAKEILSREEARKIAQLLVKGNG